MTIDLVKKRVISDDIWIEYVVTKDTELRNRIIESYLYIIKVNLKKFYFLALHNNDIDDITSECVIELINCIDRYDINRGILFETYASVRIRGTIIDYLRRNDWMPRNARKRVSEVEDAEQSFAEINNRLPTDDELADMLGVNTKAIETAKYDKARVTVLEFEETIHKYLQDSIDENSPETEYIENSLKEKLIDGINELEDNEKMVISLYYFEGLKFKEIAFVLELTQSRISQIHYSALKKLKNKISDFYF